MLSSKKQGELELVQDLGDEQLLNHTINFKKLAEFEQFVLHFDRFLFCQTGAGYLR